MTVVASILRPAHAAADARIRAAGRAAAGRRAVRCDRDVARTPQGRAVR